jgi:hypothetical protein
VKSFESSVREKLFLLSSFCREATLAYHDHSTHTRVTIVYLTNTQSSPCLSPFHTFLSTADISYLQKKEITLSIAFTMINVKNNHGSVQFYKGNKCLSLWIIENHNLSSSGEK